MAIQISIFLSKARCIFMISSSFDIFVVYDMICFVKDYLMHFLIFPKFMTWYA